MLRNPVENPTLPNVDQRLKLSINLAFSCSLRMGELLAITWDGMNISDESVAEGNSYLYVDK